jgi:anti-sigma factor RsiW
MNHPYEQLADLLDGTLDEENLAGVQSHLETCASCREDVAHAAAGREAARSLPQAAAPAELHRDVVLAAGGHGHGSPTWSRWAGVAAAAAVVVAIAIALPNVGDGGKQRAAEDTAASAEVQAAEGGARANDDVTFAVEDKNYDEKALQQLVSSSADAASSEQVPLAGARTDPAAVRCVERAVPDEATGRLSRVIQARFQGRAAYIGLYLEGPGAGQQPDLVSAWVAARDDCSFLSLAYSRTQSPT